MRITSHAASPVDCTVHPDGQVMFSVPEFYRRRGRASRRQIVETSENGERVSDTLQRALDDEISEEPGSAKMELLDEKPFMVVFKPDEKHPGGTHAKFFFFVSVTGQKRTMPKFDGDEELGPMIEMEADDLIAAMEIEGTVPLHLEATRAAVATLARKHESIYRRYFQLLSRCHLPPELTEDEWTQVYEYNKWF